MKKALFAMMLSALGLTACATFANTNASSNTNNTEQSQTAIKPKSKGLWIDVRTPKEHEEGHLVDSLNVPVDVIGQKIESIQPNKNAPIHLYCRSGRRAEVARTTLVQMGYTNVINHGGYEDLKKQGYR